MKITKQTIEHMANLSRLEIDEEEIEQIVHDVDKIIQYMDKLAMLDTSYIEPTEYLNLNNNVLREDDIKESFERDSLLACVPEKENGYLVVPGVTF